MSFEVVGADVVAAVAVASTAGAADWGVGWVGADMVRYRCWFWEREVEWSIEIYMYCLNGLEDKQQGE
jgi:hypothetical protein